MIDRGVWTRMMAGLVSVGILGALFWPVYSTNGRTSPAHHCLSNVKQVTLSLIMYESDYEAYPRENWVELTLPYGKNKEVYRCPEVKEGSGYAMNAYLLGRRAPEDSAVALVGETKDTTPGALANAFQASLRHGDRQVVGFVDGMAKLLPPGPYAALKMKPSPSKPK